MLSLVYPSACLTTMTLLSRETLLRASHAWNLTCGVWQLNAIRTNYIPNSDYFFRSEIDIFSELYRMKLPDYEGRESLIKFLKTYSEIYLFIYLFKFFFLFISISIEVKVYLKSSNLILVL